MTFTSPKHKCTAQSHTQTNFARSAGIHDKTSSIVTCTCIGRTQYTAPDHSVNFFQLQLWPITFPCDRPVNSKSEQNCAVTYWNSNCTMIITSICLAIKDWHHLLETSIAIGVLKVWFWLFILVLSQFVIIHCRRQKFIIFDYHLKLSGKQIKGLLRKCENLPELMVNLNWHNM